MRINFKGTMIKLCLFYMIVHYVVNTSGTALHISKHDKIKRLHFSLCQNHTNSLVKLNKMIYFIIK